MSTRRNVRDVAITKRGALTSLRHAQTRNPKDLSHSAVFKWVFSYLKVALTPRRKLPEYGSGNDGVFDLGAKARVVLASDWGTGTPHAYKVIDHARACKPDFAIHLGDIYYVGLGYEVEHFFLGPDGWPCSGGVKAFALNGNHEMYSGGDGYFKNVFQAFGQTASWFCVQNDYWRIVALDTGYWCKTLPFFELAFSTSLPDENIEWLRRHVFNDPADKRPVILLTHHQPYSGFEGKYRKIWRQALKHVPNIALWFWGHEHRFAVYGTKGTEKDLVHGRCIGHGGMPVEIDKAPSDGKAARYGLVAYDNRRNTAIDLPDTGFCGYCCLDFDDGELTIEYRDENNELLLTEQWQSTKSAAIGAGIVAEPGLTTRNGVPITDAIA